MCSRDAFQKAELIYKEIFVSFERIVKARIIFSKIFPKQLRREMGLQFGMMEGSSPILGIGITFASFQLTGKCPAASSWLKKIVRNTRI